MIEHSQNPRKSNTSPQEAQETEASSASQLTVNRRTILSKTGTAGASRILETKMGETAQSFLGGLAQMVYDQPVVRGIHRFLDEHDNLSAIFNFVADMEGVEFCTNGEVECSGNKEEMRWRMAYQAYALIEDQENRPRVPNEIGSMEFAFRSIAKFFGVKKRDLVAAFELLDDYSRWSQYELKWVKFVMKESGSALLSNVQQELTSDGRGSFEAILSALYGYQSFLFLSKNQGEIIDHCAEQGVPQEEIDVYRRVLRLDSSAAISKVLPPIMRLKGEFLFKLYHRPYTPAIPQEILDLHKELKSRGVEIQEHIEESLRRACALALPYRVHLSVASKIHFCTLAHDVSLSLVCSSEIQPLSLLSRFTEASYDSGEVLNYTDPELIPGLSCISQRLLQSAGCETSSSTFVVDFKKESSLEEVERTLQDLAAYHLEVS